jgi:multiple sugar transport system permease protein
MSATSVTAKATHSTGYRVRKGLGRVLEYVIMIALALFFLFPIVFMLVASFKNNETQIIRDMSSLAAFVPYGDLGIQNFRDVFDQMPFGHFLFNSVFIVGCTVLAGLVVNSLIGYSLARLRFKGRRLVLSVIIALIIIPIEAVVIPMLLMVNRFGWLDSYHVQIIPFIADAFSIFLFYQFFIGLPKDLDEAALVDGASPFRIYTSIIVPLSRPVFATVAILQFLTRWGDFLWPLMVTRGEEYRPLPVAIQQFFSQDPKVWGDIFGFASMITIPVLIVFLLFQKWFVQSVATSGVKG